MLSFCNLSNETSNKNPKKFEKNVDKKQPTIISNIEIRFNWVSLLKSINGKYMNLSLLLSFTEMHLLI